MGANVCDFANDPDMENGMFDATIIHKTWSITRELTGRILNNRKYSMRFTGCTTASKSKNDPSLLRGAYAAGTAPGVERLSE